MNKISNVLGLYVIVDPEHTGGRDCADVASSAVSGGAEVIQLRAKLMSGKTLYETALAIRELSRKTGALFIMNDAVDIAIAVGADGVHIGQDDMPLAAVRRLVGPDVIIGVSTHSVEEAEAAEAGGADYIGFGPMFSTPTKDSGTPKGPAGLRAIRGEVRIPVVAIGGINASNAPGVIEAGADAVAVISAVISRDDVEEAARDIVKAIRM